MTLEILERRLPDYYRELHILRDEIIQIVPHYKAIVYRNQIPPDYGNFSIELTILNTRVDWRIHGEEEATICALATGFNRATHYSVDFDISKHISPLIDPLRFAIPHDAPVAEQDELFNHALVEGIQYFRDNRDFMISAMSETRFDQ